MYLKCTMFRAMQIKITDNQNWRLYFRLKRYEKNYIAYQRTPMLSDYSFACKNDFHLYHIKWIYYNDYIICLAHIYFNLISAFKVNDIIPRFHISVNRQKQKNEFYLAISVISWKKVLGNCNGWARFTFIW